jgi:hypothetical protein
MDATAAARASAPQVLDLRLADLRQLFNSMDPAPFRERELDPTASDYIVDWANEAAPRAPLGLAIHLAHGTVGDKALAEEAVHEHFRRRATAKRLQLRRLLRTGRVSLIIGIAFLGLAIAVGEFIAGLIPKESYAWLVKESLVIGGWVALWRPLEIFLYDWWPLRNKARLYDRLALMPVAMLAADAAAECVA